MLSGNTPFARKTQLLSLLVETLFQMHGYVDSSAAASLKHSVLWRSVLKDHLTICWMVARFHDLFRVTKDLTFEAQAQNPPAQ